MFRGNTETDGDPVDVFHTSPALSVKLSFAFRPRRIRFKSAKPAGNMRCPILFAFWPVVLSSLWDPTRAFPRPLCTEPQGLIDGGVHPAHAPKHELAVRPKAPSTGGDEPTAGREPFLKSAPHHQQTLRKRASRPPREQVGTSQQRETHAPFPSAEIEAREELRDLLCEAEERIGSFARKTRKLAERAPRPQGWLGGDWNNYQSKAEGLEGVQVELQSKRAASYANRRLTTSSHDKRAYDRNSRYDNEGSASNPACTDMEI